jgi:hypothetical protein
VRRERVRLQGMRHLLAGAAATAKDVAEAARGGLFFRQSSAPREGLRRAMASPGPGFIRLARPRVLYTDVSRSHVDRNYAPPSSSRNVNSLLTVWRTSA